MDCTPQVARKVNIGAEEAGAHEETIEIATAVMTTEAAEEATEMTLAKAVPTYTREETAPDQMGAEMKADGQAAEQTNKSQGNIRVNAQKSRLQSQHLDSATHLQVYLKSKSATGKTQKMSKIKNKVSFWRD